MDEDREFELRKLEDHAVEYYKEKTNGYEGSYTDLIEERNWV